MTSSLQAIVSKLKTEVDKRSYVASEWRSGYNWNRKWSDGLIEQGGRIQCNDWTTVGLSTPMTTTNYMVIATVYDTHSDGKVPSCAVGSSLTTTTFKCETWLTETHEPTNEYVNWYVRGY